MKIAIIGAGNIGGAVARGWSKRNKSAKKGGELGKLELTVSGVHLEKLERIKEDCPDVSITTDNRDAVRDAEVVVIAVKPWQVKGVISEIRDLMTADKILVSFAAGVTIAELQQMLEGTAVTNIFYTIPNIAAEFGESMTFVSAADGVEQEVTDTVEALFEGVGSVFVCAEKLVAPGMLMASCGIAYVMRFLRAQTEAGVEMGFYPKDALKIAIQTMKGAAELLHSTGEHPEAAIDRVTTPAGYTIKGLNEMDHTGFNSAVIKVFKVGLN